MDDGWAIDDQLGNNTRAIITQVQKSCPQDVDRTFVIYQNAYQLDDTLKISCVIQKSVESGDEAAKEKQAEIVKSGPKSQASISLGISTAFLASLHIIFHVIVN